MNRIRVSCVIAQVNISRNRRKLADLSNQPLRLADRPRWGRRVGRISNDFTKAKILWDLHDFSWTACHFRNLKLCLFFNSENLRLSGEMRTGIYWNPSCYQFLWGMGTIKSHWTSLNVSIKARFCPGLKVSLLNATFLGGSSSFCEDTSHHPRVSEVQWRWLGNRDVFWAKFILKKLKVVVFSLTVST